MSEQSHINNNIALHIIDINIQCNVIRGHVTSCKSPKKGIKKYTVTLIPSVFGSKKEHNSVIFAEKKYQQYD